MLPGEKESTTFIDETDDFNSGQPIEFASILWRQLDRILKAGSYGADRLYINGVNELHQVLLPHHDKYYLAFIENTKTQFAELLQQYPPQKRNTVIHEFEKQMAYKMLGELIRLMTKKGLLPEKGIRT